MGTRSSSTENWGWAVTWRRCLNTPPIPVQAPTLDPKLADRCYWIDLRHSFAHACFFFPAKRGQHGSRESCILLENEPNQSFVARTSKHLSLAVPKFRTASEERSTRGYDQCVQALLPGIVAPEIHRNDHSYSLCELKLWTFKSSHKNFAWWTVTRRSLKKHRTVKIEGWALAQRWVLARDDTI